MSTCNKYEVKSVVCDYGVFEDNELKLILNSRANALKIKEILETDGDMSKPYVWKDKRTEELEKENQKLKNDLKGACQKYHAKCDYLQKQLKERSKQIIEKIIDKYNLNRKPITDCFGDTSFGYATINADKLKEFLDNLLKEFNYEE